MESGRSQVKHILFISANRIGDAVLTTGVLSYLVETYPEARFTIACGPLAVSLFRGVPRLDRIIVLKKQSWKRHWWKFWWSTVGTRWDLVVDIRNSAFSRLLLRKRLACRTHKGQRHTVLANAAVLGLSPPPAPSVFLDPASVQEAERLLGDQADRPILAVGPAANWPAKQWPAERFGDVIRRVTAPDGVLPDAAVMIAAAPNEREQIQPLVSSLPPERTIDTIGADLLTVAACLARSSLYIGNDSGLMHLACAVRTPTIGLFGPSDERLYGPWGPKTLAVRTPETVTELRSRIGPTTPNLMESLAVTTVLDGIEKMSNDGMIDPGRAEALSARSANDLDLSMMERGKVTAAGSGAAD